MAVRYATPDRNFVIIDKNGEPCYRAGRQSYPLQATCVCGEFIRCADGTADWVHAADDRPTCAEESK